MSTPLLKKYILYQNELNSKYKTDCIVLIMNGSFYNIYEFNCPQLKIGCATQVSQLLNILLTRNNKNKPHSISNPIMCGMPVNHISRHLSTLVSNNMTVAIYNQIDNDSDPKDHELFKIISPSTYIDEDITNNNCVLMCILINKYTCVYTNKPLHSLHISYIDLSTGNNNLVECYDVNNISSEINKYIQSVNPSEIITNYSNLKTHILTHNIENKKYYNDNSYQISCLSKIFKNDTLLPIIEYLKLENKPDLRVCYLHLLQFAYEHDPNIITKINKPSFINNNNHLLLNTDAQHELNIFNKSRPSLFSIMNKTNTKFGERELKYRLFHPIFCANTLNTRYNNISLMSPKYKSFKKQLSQICDVEKMFRRLYIHTLSPNSFGSLHNSFEHITSILKSLINHFNIDEILISKWESFTKYYNTQFNTSIMIDITDFKTSFFNTGIYSQIDNLNKIICDIKSSFNHIATLLENDKGVNVTLQPDQTFKTTKKAWNSIKDETRQIKLNIGKQEIICNLSDFVNIENDKKNYVKLKCDVVNTLHFNLSEYEEQISRLIKETYYDVCDHIQKNYSDIIRQVIGIITEIDISVCGAEIAKTLNYNKPKLVDVETSYFKAKQIRHPIIEQINDNQEYIPNDVHLNNMLLFGLNSSGKSSLLRSIGCNIILAQSGLFVACKSLTYSPYKQLISKIGNSDDLYSGQSTFITEMYELKNILEKSDNKSMVLCDELTSGTETNSSIGIVCSTILKLLENKCSFLFTTHLHEILEFDEITNNKDLSIKHFKIKMEEGKIGFDRVLREGSGDTNYGIEIANYLDIQTDFIKMCHNFRNRYIGRNLNILENKRSRYNSKIIIDSCSICGENKDLHTHHIREQNEADENGMIEHFHKNKKFNLLVVCEKCHQKIHNS